MLSRRVMIMVEVETDETIKDLKKVVITNLSLNIERLNIEIIQVQANVIKKEVI